MQTAMRSSVSGSLEHGLERGLPWGRDLYTFVTSAAGHMMRTLQKPRKNRPSKRQVNHRRFLHNMIQRKFAEIEAANHRLTSSLYFKEGEKAKSVFAVSHSLQDPCKHSNTGNRNFISKSGNNEINDFHGSKDQHDHRTHYEHQPKTLSSTGDRVQSNEGKLNETEVLPISSPVSDLIYTQEFNSSNIFPDRNQQTPTCSFSGDFQTQRCDSAFICGDQNLDFSPSVSPFSVSSSDLPILTLTEESVCYQAQASPSGDQFIDIMELLGVCDRDSEGFVDLDGCYENTCLCLSNGRIPASANDGYLQPPLEGNITTVDILHCSKVDEGQMLNLNCTQSYSSCSQTINQDPMPGQLHTSLGHCEIASMEMYNRPCSEFSSILVDCTNKASLAWFDGVAQSFSVPPQDRLLRTIPTPPHEDDWMFTNILTDGEAAFC